jgi:hypothetical protein
VSDVREVYTTDSVNGVCNNTKTVLDDLFGRGTRGIFPPNIIQHVSVYCKTATAPLWSKGYRTAQFKDEPELLKLREQYMDSVLDKQLGEEIVKTCAKIAGD